MIDFKSIAPGRILNGIGGTITQYDVIDEITAKDPAHAPAIDSYWIEFPGTRGWTFLWTAVDNMIAKCKQRGVGLNMSFLMKEKSTFDFGDGCDDQIVAGKYDAELDQMGGKLRDSGLPIICRIGNEVNAKVYGIQIGVFPDAYRHVRARWEAVGATNVSYAWCIIAPGEKVTLPNGAFSPDWYPGDAYVDWLSIDLFHHNEFSGVTPQAYPTSETQQKTWWLLTNAQKANKPVLIGETAPILLNLDSTLAKGQQVYATWFLPWFTLLAAWMPTIRATCIHPVDYSKAGTASFVFWGNCRFQDNDFLWGVWTFVMGYQLNLGGVKYGFMHRDEFMG
jgi:hypothetical protein